MTHINEFVPAIAALQARADKIAPWSFVHILCGEGGWSASCSNLRINIRELADPFEALEAMDRAIAKIEDRDGTLARTLGIAA